MSPYRSDLAAMIRRRAALVRELIDLDVVLEERVPIAAPKVSRWVAWRLRRALEVLERYGPGTSWSRLLRRLLGADEVSAVRGRSRRPRPPAPAPIPNPTRFDDARRRCDARSSVRVEYEAADGVITGVDLGSTPDRTVIAVVDRDRGVIEFEEIDRETPNPTEVFE